MIIKAVKIFSQNGFLENRRVTIEDGRIAKIEPLCREEADVFLLAGGYFDTHTHGSAGFDTLNPNVEALSRYLCLQASHGVTDVLLTTACASKENLKSSVQFIRRAMKAQRQGLIPGAIIRGIHLEGPFLNPNRLGTMVDEHLMKPDIETLLEITDGFTDDIRVITIAPEMPGASELATFLTGKGVCVQLGHSDAKYEEADKAYESGFSSVCHTFNACRPIHHRDPGLIVSALTRKDIYCEVICDFKHLHPGIVKLIGQCKLPDRFVLISDSVKGLDMPDGIYVDSLGKTTVVENGIIRSASGALDGGACYLDTSVKNLSSLFVDTYASLRSASLTPAERIRYQQALGSVDIGKEANLVLLDNTLSVQKTVIGGKFFSQPT